MIACEAKAVPTPSLRAWRETGSDPERHAAWCPWCEAVHWHGAGEGHRAAHCFDRTGSPLVATGYDLAIGDTPRVRAPCHDGMPLAVKLRAGGNRLRRAFVAILLGRAAARDTIATRIGEGGPRLEAWPAWGGRWSLRPRGGTREAGDHLLGLAARLHGATDGVVAVRILEAVAGQPFDAPAALSIARAVDAWVERGAPAGEGRRSSS